MNVNDLFKLIWCNLGEEGLFRDLTDPADKRGLIHRVHGGALSPQSERCQGSFRSRQRFNCDKKRAIAASSIEYIFEGIVLGLDASSTSWHFAQMIPDIPCTVVTNSMHNITALVNSSNKKHCNGWRLFSEIWCFLWTVIRTIITTFTYWY